jgi:hypothetical protein
MTEPTTEGHVMPERVEIRIPQALGLTKKQAKQLEDYFQKQLADVLRGAAAAAKNKLVHPEPKGPKAVAIRAKAKNQIV